MFALGMALLALAVMLGAAATMGMAGAGAFGAAAALLALCGVALASYWRRRPA